MWETILLSYSPCSVILTSALLRVVDFIRVRSKPFYAVAKQPQQLPRELPYLQRDQQHAPRLRPSLRHWQHCRRAHSMQQRRPGRPNSHRSSHTCQCGLDMSALPGQGCS